MVVVDAVHALFWLYICALMSGAASSVVALFVYAQHRKPVEFGFGLFLLSLLGIVASLAVQQYGVIASADSKYGMSVASIVLMIIGAGGYMFAWPFFYHPLVGTRAPRWLVAVYLAIGFAFLALALSLFVSPESTFVLIALNVMLFGMIGYGIVSIGVRYKRIGDRRLRKAVRVFLILSIVFFPLMYLDSILMYLPPLPLADALDGTALPIFFIVLNVMAIRFAGTYLNEPAYLSDGEISAYFRSIYGISEREGEIIASVIDGNTTREVADLLFISAKTVENHVYNIYQKTGVRNRVELVNLILEHRGN